MVKTRGGRGGSQSTTATQRTTRSAAVPGPSGLQPGNNGAGSSGLSARGGITTAVRGSRGGKIQKDKGKGKKSNPNKVCWTCTLFSPFYHPNH